MLALLLIVTYARFRYRVVPQAFGNNVREIPAQYLDLSHPARETYIQFVYMGHRQ